MEVYLYMEEHHIGIDHARYWVARMDVMRKCSDLVAVVALLNSLKQSPHLQEYPPSHLDSAK
jgi:hypothetical protein